MLDQSVGKDHEVEVAIAAGAHCVRSDHNQLELALLNLVINARDAMPDGGIIRVELDAERKDGGDEIVIRVIDQGEGMSADTQRRAVEPFFTTKAQGRGTGLGPGAGVRGDAAVGRFGRHRQQGRARDRRSRCGSRRATRRQRRAAARHRRFAAKRGRCGCCWSMTIRPCARRSPRSFEDGGHIVDSVGDGRVALTAIEHCRL